ncbi:MAG: CZB domain-containing protein, partial [Sulfuricellaceae bacterium]|nr:CZB domain-containing protein [Sulfuricellaceae bacterium]
VLMGLSEKHADDFASHTACRLGKWYYEGDGRSCCATLPGYKEIEHPHRQVHAAGKLAVELFLQGDHAAALAQANEMEQASMAVLRELERIGTGGEHHA